MDIQEFLLARIAEDEAGADTFHEKYCGWCLHEGPGFNEGGCICGHPQKILRECVAKRAIIEDTYWQPEKRPADAELHARARHPAYEYATTEGPRKQWDDADEPPEGDGWESNTEIGYGEGWARLDYTEESYWRRLKPEAERREWEQYIPRTLRALAAIYSDHPDYQQEWSL